MSEIFSICKNMFYMFYGNQIQILFIVLAIVFLLMQKKTDKISKRMLLYMVIFAVIYSCPITAKIIMDYCIGRAVYWRMLWLLPTGIIFAYALTNIINDVESKWKKCFIVFILISIIAKTGNLELTEPYFVKAENNTKLDNNIIEICESIEADAQMNHIENIRGVFPDELVCYIRQYDGNIGMAYGRDVIRGICSNEIYNILHSENIDFSYLSQCMINGNYDYFVWNMYDEEMSANLKMNGYKQVAFTSDYCIYRIMR